MSLTQELARGRERLSRPACTPWRPLAMVSVKKGVTVLSVRPSFSLCAPRSLRAAPPPTLRSVLGFVPLTGAHSFGQNRWHLPCIGMSSLLGTTFKRKSVHLWSGLELLVSQTQQTLSFLAREGMTLSGSLGLAPSPSW
jgi:hypothetical protein